MASSRNTRVRLTDKQKRILEFVRTRVRADGMPPTHEEIRRELKLGSANGVRQHLRLIQNKGYIQLCPGKSRGIKLLLPEAESVPDGLAEIPVLGRIAAGKPILAEQHFDESIAVSDELFPQGDLFALRIEGDSMVNVGITSGDLAVVRQQPVVDNGRIAAVLLDDEATLKRVYAYKDHIRLKAENDDVPDIHIAKAQGFDVRILGLYVGLIRRAR